MKYTSKNSPEPTLSPEHQRLVERSLAWLQTQGQKEGSLDQFIKDVTYVRSLWRKAGISEDDVKALIPQEA